MAVTEPGRGHDQADGGASKEARRVGVWWGAKWWPRSGSAQRRAQARERAAAAAYDELTAAPSGEAHLRSHELEALIEHTGDYEAFARHVDNCDGCRANLKRLKQDFRPLRAYPPPCD